MPYVWTRNQQMIEEAFKGPRSKDAEFEKKIQEMKIIERAILQLKSGFQNYVDASVAIKNFSREIYGCIRSIYDKDSPYNEIADDIQHSHIEIEKLYKSFVQDVNAINAKTSGWNQMFASSKTLLQQREDKRKLFEHYDEKLEKLYKAKNERKRAHGKDSAKDLEVLERVYRPRGFFQSLYFLTFYLKKLQIFYI